MCGCDGSYQCGNHRTKTCFCDAAYVCGKCRSELIDRQNYGGIIDTSTDSNEKENLMALFAIYAYNSKSGAIHVDDHITAVDATVAERVLIRRLSDKQFNNEHLVVKVTPLA